VGGVGSCSTGGGGARRKADAVAHKAVGRAILGQLQYTRGGVNPLLSVRRPSETECPQTKLARTVLSGCERGEEG